MKTWKHCAFIGVLAILVLVFAFGCSGNNLNGTWVDDKTGTEYKYKNGNFEVYFPDMGNPFSIGTYTTKGNELERRATHYYGFSLGLNRGLTHVLDESKWYSKTELKSALGDLNQYEWQMTERDFNQLFEPWTLTYSVSGNTLTTFAKDGSERTHTKIMSGAETKITNVSKSGGDKKITQGNKSGGSSSSSDSLDGIWETNVKNADFVVIEFSGNNYAVLRGDGSPILGRSGTYSVFENKIELVRSNGMAAVFSFSRSGNTISINSFQYHKR